MDDPGSRCPPPGLLAGLAEDRLVARERAEVEGHVATCDPCRAAVAALLADADAGLGPAPQSSTVPARPRLTLLRGIAAAAAAAAILAAAFVLDVGRSAPRTTETALADAARALADERPDLFGGFRPLAAGETLAPALEQKRGAMQLLAPAGAVLEVRPALRWEDVPGVPRWRVTMRTAEGEPLWTAESASASLAYPAAEAELSSGARYIWEVAGDGPLGAERARRAFDVATAQTRERYDAVTALLAKRAEPRLVPLLRAQWALRHGLYAAAAKDAAEFAAANPADSAGRATLDAARRALGETGPR